MWTADVRFGDLYDIREFITPNNLAVRRLTEQLIRGKETEAEKALACWKWVVEEIDYPLDDRGRNSDACVLLSGYTGAGADNIGAIARAIKRNGLAGFKVRLGQTDFWQMPAEVLGWRNTEGRLMADCEGSSVALASMLRYFTDDVYAHLGTVESYGHCWVEWRGLTLETTLDRLPGNGNITEVIRGQSPHNYRSDARFNDHVLEGDLSRFEGFHVGALPGVERCWGVRSKISRMRGIAVC
ncbi:MAG: hypothetical protein WC551_09635 [Patescibacteria group bacterium]